MFKNINDIEFEKVEENERNDSIVQYKKRSGSVNAEKRAKDTKSCIIF